ncbi:MAG: DNA topoisomerase [Lachnospiraceae bacterium]
MGKTLIITEKPSVAREYAAILKVNGKAQGRIENQEYVITWCVGHLIEMSYPEKYDSKYKTWRLSDLPFLPETYQYDVIDSVREQYNIVHDQMHREDISTILYAGDSGREGEVIIQLIRDYGGVREGMEERRVWIDSCTEEEILRGIREAKGIEEYDNLANAGIMRGIEDYAMGINFSRALSVKYGRMLNRAADTKNYAAIAIGRVMTCVLGMVVRREREIREFQETPFYRIISTFSAQEASYTGEWKAVEGSAYFASPLLYKENGFRKKEDAEKLIASLQTQSQAVIESVQRSTEKKKPPLLFNLAELQAECSKRYKISPDTTLKIAQELYERKLTTYPRTDARVLTTAIAKEIVKNIRGLLAFSPVKDAVQLIIEEKRYAHLEKTMYTDDKKVTDHYAIIPTGQVSEYARLSQIQKQVYELIVRRFLSIFYPPTVFQKANIVTLIGKERFFTSVKVMKDPGYLVIAQPKSVDPKDQEKEAENQKLLQLVTSFKKGDSVQISGFEIKEGKTSPPKRYTSGSMVLAMENAGNLIEDEELRAQIKGAGIGTSATRAGIIEKLVQITYLNLNTKTQILTPSKLGEMIYEVVYLTMPSMLNPEMTASWEKGLAGVEQGNITTKQYRKTLEDYVRRYVARIKETDLTEVIAKRIAPFATGSGYETEGCSERHEIQAVCPLCGGQMQTTPFGYGCSNYNVAEKSGCRFSIGIIAGHRLSESEAETLLRDGKIEHVRGFRSKAGKSFSAGLRLEDATDKDGKPTKRVAFDFPDAETTESTLSCPKCQKKLLRETWNYTCSCGFSISRRVAGKTLSEETIQQLISTGKSERLDGFYNKAGKPFSATLKADQTGRITFDFQ